MFDRLLAWLRRQFAPTVPVARVRRPDPTPPPVRAVVFRPCPGCGVLVAEWAGHACEPRVLREDDGDPGVMT